MFASNRLSDGVQVIERGNGHKVSFGSPDLKKSTLNPSKVKRKRKSLKLLQRSAQDENQLVGNERIDEVKVTKGKRKMDDTTAVSSPRKIQKSIFNYMSSPLKIYEDSQPDTLEIADKNLKTSSEKMSSAVIDLEAHQLMVQEEVPEQYWKEVAEERRVALAEALEENEKLHTENVALKEEVEGLKGMAEQAEYFANMVKLLTTEEEVNGDSSKTMDGSSDTENISEQESCSEGSSTVES